MDDEFPIQKCVCMDVSFEALKAAGVRDLEQIQREYGCSTECGLCLPYLVQMLKTGQTRFRISESDPLE